MGLAGVERTRDVPLLGETADAVLPFPSGLETLTWVVRLWVLVRAGAWVALPQPPRRPGWEKVPSGRKQPGQPCGDQEGTAPRDGVTC